MSAVYIKHPVGGTLPYLISCRDWLAELSAGHQVDTVVAVLRPIPEVGSEELEIEKCYSSDQDNDGLLDSIILYLGGSPVANNEYEVELTITSYNLAVSDPDHVDVRYVKIRAVPKIWLEKTQI